MATLALIGYYIWNCLSTLSSRLTTCCNSVPLNCPCCFGFWLLRGLAFLVTLVCRFDFYFLFLFSGHYFDILLKLYTLHILIQLSTERFFLNPYWMKSLHFYELKNKQTKRKQVQSLHTQAFLAGYGVTLLELQNSQAGMVFCNLQASWSKSRIPRQPVLHKGTFWGAWMSWPTLCISTSW